MFKPEDTKFTFLSDFQKDPFIFVKQPNYFYDLEVLLEMNTLGF